MDGSAFAAGEVLAGRYRLVARLGRGGMGEVYRAEDLKLGTSVALKFLPPNLILDAEALARFHHEVRISRQVAHRNVCRVFDIAEVDGHCFLTMEYIDGEDLGSLLMRIGRLPEPKALELAHQLCSGLAAAHEAGILHRDLKPSNVMIDGKGRAKITDFGVAHLVDELQSTEELAGTPAYMAPELLQGEPASVRTDLYALGLVLYEMFTGTKPFEEEALLSLVVQGGRSGPPSLPSEHVPTLDPTIEDVLLATLDEEASERPASALEIAAHLPGGDPLAAALAAGETPSPEMVASAPDRGVLAQRWAWVCALVVIVLLPVTHGLGRGSMVGMVDEILPPSVLEDRAHQVLREIGFDAPVVDHVGAFRFEDEVLDRAAPDLRSREHWQERMNRRPMPLTYWYRQGPAPLLPWRVAWTPEPFDPPPVPGEAFVVIDALGRLEQLRLEISADAEDDPAIRSSVDWAPLFRAAALDPERFLPVEGARLARVHGLPDYDRAWSWIGRDRSGVQLRIDAASLAGRPVLFTLSDGEPELRREAAEAPIPEGKELLLITLFLLLGTALFLTYQHLKRRRADRRGAGVLGLGTALISFVGLMAGAHHVSTGEELFLLLEILEATAFRGVAVLLIYLALEPLIRRRAPEMLITWTRLLAGRRWDPRVGRDLLAGLVLGVGASALCMAVNLWAPLLGDRPLQIYGLGEKLSGVGGVVYWLTFSLFLEVSGTLLLCLLYALLVAWWRRPIFAGAGLWAVVVVVGDFSTLAVFGGLLFVFALARFGFLATLVTWTCVDWVLLFPTGAELGDWWLLPSILPSILLAALAVYAARTASGFTKQERMRRVKELGRSSFGRFPASTGAFRK